MKRILKTLLVLFAGFLLAGNAWGLTLTLESDGTSLPFTDGGAGIVTGMASVGDWTTNITTGMSSPILGSNTAPVMTLSTINVSSSAAKSTSLKITLTETFADAEDLSNVGSLLSLSGTTLAAGGTAQYRVIFDDGSVVYDNTFTQLSFIDDVSGRVLPVFSDYDDGNADGFTITIEMILTHLGSGFSNLGASLASEEPSSVPVPATFSLLGLGLLAFAGISRRKAE